MKKATREGVKLESFFEKKENDDITADNILPDVKPTALIGRMKTKKVLWPWMNNVQLLNSAISVSLQYRS